MFLSYNSLYSKLQAKTHDTDAATLAAFKQDLNIGLQEAYSRLESEYFYATAADLTVADQASYPRPYCDAQIESIKVTISSVDYIALPFPGSYNQWIALTGGAAASTSDYPTYFYVKRNTYELYPMPATSNYMITLRVKKITKELTEANYTTGTIKTMVNGSTAVVGNTGTAWTTPSVAIAGRFFKIDNDNYWYEISSVTDATNLVLAREFGGTALTAATAAYTIGEGSLLPDAYQHIPVYYALAEYYVGKENLKLAQQYERLWEKGLENLKSYSASAIESCILEEDITIPYAPDWPTGLI